MRIFLDANVLFSAAKSDGAVRRLLGLLRTAGHELWADAYVIEEARRNLSIKSPESVADLEALLPSVHCPGTVKVDRKLESMLPLPEKDQPVLAAAIRCGCKALVTGDRTHFGTLFGEAIQGVAIHSPASIARALIE